MFKNVFVYMEVSILYVAGTLACVSAAYGQAIVSTVAGGGFVDNAAALKTYLNNPQGVALDGSGNLYIADGSRILRVDHASGNLTAVAGGGPSIFDGDDGPALTVRIAPTDLVVNSSGNVLFLDSSMLRQLNVQQAKITTLAGQNGKNGSTGDSGPASGALLNEPQQLCLDAAGNIYIVEGAGYVRRIDGKTGVITKIAGTGGPLFAGDGGLATAATLERPAGIAVDSSGNLYIADTGDARIRKIAAGSGMISTIAGNGHVAEGGDGGSALKATFVGLGALAMDSQNNLSLIDGDRVRRISASNGTIATVAGNGTAALAGDGGPATQAAINTPAALALDSAGDLYIADSGNRRVREVAAAGGTISTIAGTSQNGDGGLAAGAVLHNPLGLAVDAAGDLFIAEGSVIREVSAATGLISTFAGGGTSTADGVSLLQAKLSPISLAFDSGGDLIVGEAGLIRRLNKSGTVTTIAGTGVVGYSGDGGAATHAKIGYVSALAIDGSGRILFADSGNKRLRRIDTSGTVSTVAGNGLATFTGAGQAATATGVGNVAGLAVDASGNIYIGGLNTYFLLKISTAGTVSIAGGVGGCGYIGDGGTAVMAGICQPSSLASDAGGNIYVGDGSCYCVRRIAADTGVIQTVVGTGNPAYRGDNGPATEAQLRSVSGIALHGTTLYVADGTSAVVRGVTPNTPPTLPGKPNFTSVVNSASYKAAAVAPGEMITFYGNYMGPPAPGYLTLGSDNKVANKIPNVNVQVFFDDVPAPLTYVSAGQINAIAPYSVANGFSTVKIVTDGGTFSSNSYDAAPAAPGVFYFAIVNQDGTLNSATHPAPIGSYVVMYGTGLGQTVPAGVDGALTPVSNYPKQVHQASITISRNPLFGTQVPMRVTYAGPAPGGVNGFAQINVQVPEGAERGENSMEIAIAGQSSAPITLYVQ